MFKGVFPEICASVNVKMESPREYEQELYPKRLFPRGSVYMFYLQIYVILRLV